MAWRLQRPRDPRLCVGTRVGTQGPEYRPVQTQTRLPRIPANLRRPAGFGATIDELDELVQVPYEQLVDDLLYPERFPEVDDTLLRRYYLELNNPDTHGTWQAHWIYRMVNTRRPLQEKIALFWHHVFATSIGKSEHTPSGVARIETWWYGQTTTNRGARRQKRS